VAGLSKRTWLPWCEVGQWAIVHESHEFARIRGPGCSDLILETAGPAIIRWVIRVIRGCEFLCRGCWVFDHE
jgi:hypothetical protein